MPSATTVRTARVAPAFVLALAAFAVFSVAFTPFRASQDEWWHLKAGRWMAENRRLTGNDIFTDPGADMPWHNHEWLSQLAFWGVFRAGAGPPPAPDRAWGAAQARWEIDGMAAVVGFKALVVLATSAAVFGLGRQRGARVAVAALVALAAAEVGRRTIYARPPVFSYLLLAVFLGVLHAWKSGRLRTRWLAALVPLAVVWANLHGMVLLAIVAVGGYAAGEALELAAARFGSPTAPRSFRALAGLSVLTAAMVLSAMAQPSGWHLFFLGRNFTADPILSRIIAEMIPTPLPWHPAGPRYLSFWLFAGVFAAALAAHRGRLPHGADYILTAFFLWQGAAHLRLLPLAAIACAGPLAWLLEGRLAAWESRRPTWKNALSAAPAALTAALALWMTVGADRHVGLWREPVTFLSRNLDMLSRDPARATDLYAYPRPLMDFLVRADPPGRLMSQVNYCGYPMWRLAPERLRLFTDNRFDLFGSRFKRVEEAVFAAVEPGDRLFGDVVTEGWRDTLARLEIRVIVTDRATPLMAALRADAARPPETATATATAAAPGARFVHVHDYLPPRAPAADGGFAVWMRSDDAATSPPVAAALARAGELDAAMRPAGQPPPPELDRMAAAASRRPRQGPEK